MATPFKVVWWIISCFLPVLVVLCSFMESSPWFLFCGKSSKELLVFALFILSHFQISKLNIISLFNSLSINKSLIWLQAYREMPCKTERCDHTEGKEDHTTNYHPHRRSGRLHGFHSRLVNISHSGFCVDLVVLHPVLGLLISPSV